MEKIFLNKLNLSEFYPQEVIELLGIFKKAGYEARIVGGAVRDILLNRKIEDIDLAINATPPITKKILQSGKIKTLDYGIAYGTVTAVLKSGQNIEITSLREDIKTDGRHAEVSYGTNWEEDAKRRDFTINALYADSEGNLYDYVGGLKDIQTKTLKFIGDAKARIKEDYLRILRYFRFISYFPDINYNAAELQECSKQASNLKQISKERITKELSKILVSNNALKALELMEKAEILNKILPINTNIKSFEQLILVQKELALPKNFISSLSALLNYKYQDLEPFLRLSKSEQEKLKRICEAESIKTKQSALKAKYYLGETLAIDILVKSAGLDLTNTEQYKELQEYLNNTKLKNFPITGEDLIKLGFRGKELGQKLKELEQYWLEQNMQPTKTEILAKVK